MRFQLWLLTKIAKLLDRFNNRLTYGILKPCYRCTYAKSFSGMLCISDKRGPRAIVNFNGSTYARSNRSKCLGWQECGKCFEAVIDDSKFPCKWNEL